MQRSYNRLIAIGFFLIWLLGAPAATAASEGRIQWRSYAEGEMLRREEGKAALIYFFAVWCTYCTQMEKETFSDPAVVDLVNRYFVPVKVDVDVERSLAAQFGVRGLPATVFMMEADRRIGPVPGFIPAARFVSLLKQAR